MHSYCFSNLVVVHVYQVLVLTLLICTQHRCLCCVSSLINNLTLYQTTSGRHPEYRHRNRIGFPMKLRTPVLSVE